MPADRPARIINIRDATIRTVTAGIKTMTHSRIEFNTEERHDETKWQ